MGILHEKAAETYNARLSLLATRLKPRPPRSQDRASPSPSRSDVHVAQALGPGDIDLDSYREYMMDHKGQRKACFFYTKNGVVGLQEEDHNILVQVTRRIASDRGCRDLVSEEFVYLCAINWLKGRVERPSETQADFTDFFEAEVDKVVTQFEVWLPIPVVQITHPFQIGRVTFRRITKQMMDERFERCKASSSPKAETVFDHKRSLLQGTTAACVSVHAEPIRGKQLAEERAEASIAVLRLACPVMTNPYQWAPIDPSMIDRLGSSIMLQVDEGKIVGEQTSLHERMLHQWILKREDIDFNLRTLWGFGHNLLIIEQNEFQEVLLKALIHYSKSILKQDIAERLLFIVTALEALFIKDPGESIVQNLRERIAALAGPSKADRLKIVETIGRIYALRSGFVHRAVPVSDMIQLEDFMRQAWVAFLFILNNYNKWSTKADFLRMLDEHKFTGPEFSTEGLPNI